MTPDAYREFRHDAVDALRRLNEVCDRLYRIGAWPRWDYELRKGTLTFSEDGITKVIAAVQVVGTTSRTSKDWLWGWANRSLPEGVTSRLREVRDFGAVEGLGELTTELLPDDEYLGWALTAVAARILGSKGGYRVASDGGFIYFVYTDIAWARETAIEDTTPLKQVACDTHDEGCATYVCAHLVTNPAQAWFSNEPSDLDRWPDAWCGACEEVFQEQGEWNEQNEDRAETEVLCHLCYEKLRAQATEHRP